MAMVVVVTVMYSSKWTKVEVPRIVGLGGQKIPNKNIPGLKTNCALSKTFMRAEGKLRAKSEGAKSERIYGFRVLRNRHTSLV